MESTAFYNTGGSLPATLESFSNRPCTLPFNHPEYVPPTPQEVDQLIKLKGWSQTKSAALVGISFSKKGSSTIRKWRADSESPSARIIPYSAWRLLLLYAGVVTIDDGLDALIRFNGTTEVDS